jgi:hypothetical protein
MVFLDRIPGKEWSYSMFVDFFDNNFDFLEIGRLVFKDFIAYCCDGFTFLSNPSLKQSSTFMAIRFHIKQCDSRGLIDKIFYLLF